MELYEVLLRSSRTLLGLFGFRLRRFRIRVGRRLILLRWRRTVMGLFGVLVRCSRAMVGL